MDTVPPVPPSPVRAAIRALVLLTVVVVSSVATPQPAVAAAEVKLSIGTYDTTTFRESAGNGMFFQVYNNGDAPAADLVLVVDGSGLAAGVNLNRVVDGPCTIQNRRATCRWPVLAPQSFVEVLLDSEVVVGTKPGPAGSMTITAAAAEATAAPRSLAVEVAVPIYADLYPVSDSPRALVGDVVTVTFRVTNKGPGESGYWAIHVGRDIEGLEFVAGPCDTDADGHECAGRVLASGQSHTIQVQFRVTAARNYYCGIGFIYTHPDPDRSDGLCVGNGIVTYAGAVTGGGGGGGGGGSGGSGPAIGDDPSPVPSPSASASSASSPAASRSPSRPTAAAAATLGMVRPSDQRGFLLPISAAAVVGMLVAAAVVWHHMRRRAEPPAEAAEPPA